jgi:antitoxin component YwqK of YwqJK toxin-antitoxin module
MIILYLKSPLISSNNFLPDKLPVVLILLFSLFISVSCQKTEKAFYPDGSPKSSIPKDRHGRLNGEAKWWYENGSIQIIADYKNGQLDGEITRFTETGRKQSESSYIHGRKNGLEAEWNINGEISVEKTYRNDTLDGICRQYDEQGNKIVEGNYKDGFFEGRWLYFNSTGTLIGEGDFKRGNGAKLSWNEEGKLIGKATYRDNMRHGQETWYDGEDRITRIRTFDAGELVADSVISPVRH